jgi:uncharacterized membrane protein YheB (UPF0754 family)
VHLDEWWIYVSMPLIAAAIGYVTKLAAIEMMFRPIEFVGVRPFLGWQGIVPRYADRMARTAVRILTGRLLTAEELLDRIDVAAILPEIEQPLRRMVDELLAEIALRYQPTLWECLPAAAKQKFLDRAYEETPRIVERIFTDLRDNAAEVLNLEDMTVAVITRDKVLLNRLIRDVARDELAFIVRCGIWFGLGIGVVQALGWALTGSHLVMPLFGAFTGLFSDWLALRMVFRPIERRYYLPRWGWEPALRGRIQYVLSWQGRFHLHRAEVTAGYAQVIAEEVLTPANLIEGLVHGPSGDKLFGFVHHELERVIDEQAGVAKPLIVVWIGGARLQELKRDLVRLMLDRAPALFGHADARVVESLDLNKLIEARMTAMTAAEYEDLLRPAFKQDEWKLVAVGAVLGFLVGEAQLLLVLHFR